MEYKMTDPFEMPPDGELELLSNIFNCPPFSEISECLSEVLNDNITSPQQPRMEVKDVHCDTDPLHLNLEIGNLPSMLSDMEELFQPTGSPHNLFESILNEPGVISGNEGQVGVSSASSARSGSQAFHYVQPKAVFETHGIPTLSRSNDTTTTTPTFYKPKLATVLQDTTTTTTTTTTEPPYTTTTPVPDQTNTNTPPTTNTCTTTKKKRKRRRKVDKDPTEAQKKRLYTLEPFQDTQEEKKRKDAIRAKNCRDRNRNKVIELEKKLGEVEREKKVMAEEVMGRRIYEKKILEVLKMRYNILVEPYRAPVEDGAIPTLDQQ